MIYVTRSVSVFAESVIVGFAFAVGWVLAMFLFSAVLV
jgi:Na+-translocating ferredoxin:NAD+ oxidoreductase RnfA subunit